MKLYILNFILLLVTIMNESSRVRIIISPNATPRSGTSLSEAALTALFLKISLRWSVMLFTKLLSLSRRVRGRNAIPYSPWIWCGHGICSGQWNASRNYMSLPCGSFKSQCVLSGAAFPSAAGLERVADLVWVLEWAPQPNLSGQLVQAKNNPFLSYATEIWGLFVIPV